MCAKAYETATTVLFRSYTSGNTGNNFPCTICDAIRATSAASSFFEAVTIGPHKRKFVDGALGVNNPIEQIWNEAQEVWCPPGTELKDLLKCVISIGTGDPGLKPISDGLLTFFSETLVRIITDTADTAKRFISTHRLLYEQKRYFRFNVQQGLQEVGLEEYKKTALIDAATTEYMEMQETKLGLSECALNLKLKKCAYSDEDFS